MKSHKITQALDCLSDFHVVKKRSIAEKDLLARREVGSTLINHSAKVSFPNSSEQNILLFVLLEKG